jgi:CubicO group peptidase (beta-lactamase class C family)
VLHTEAIRTIERFIERRRAEALNPALVLGLTDREQTRYVGRYGVANLGSAVPVGPGTLFEIGSVSKTFAAIVAMQAQEAGLLDLEAPVQEYLPWFEVRSPYDAPITPHHLLSHSAGLVYSSDASPDPRGTVWRLRDLAVGFAPGERFYYSEPGYQTLTLILETVYAKPYADIVREGILHPLRMSASVAALTHAVRPCMATGYRHLYDDRPSHISHPLVPATWLEFNSSDGAIASTATDMVKFVRMLLNGGQGPHTRILSEQRFAQMIEEKVPGSEYGYGIYTWVDEEGTRHLAHGGDMPGYEGGMSLDLTHGLGTVVLATQPYPAGLWPQVHRMWRAAGEGRTLPEVPPPSDPTYVENAAEYAGVYGRGEQQVAFVAEDQRLYLDCGGDLLALEAHGTDRFYANHPDHDRHLWQFGRSDGADDEAGPVVEVAYGPDWYAGEGYDGVEDVAYPAAWDAYVGHYRSHNPWLTNFRVYVRQGVLWFAWPWGDEERLAPLADGVFRVGEEAYLPERIAFDQIAAGEALRATFSGCDYYRFFTA